MRLKSHDKAIDLWETLAVSDKMGHQILIFVVLLAFPVFSKFQWLSEKIATPRSTILLPQKCYFSSGPVFSYYCSYASPNLTWPKKESLATQLSRAERLVQRIKDLEKNNKLVERILNDTNVHIKEQEKQLGAISKLLGQ
ncbi:unnamed protein product [Caenorhabditis auriculariae]|uniref:Uncharacterized protein n=1 Tax=Caenorhabditis auriculariae TaxID=2777116 RepID=A0A8S1I0E8_9PELO|nr:unnamed protein product [Caenorhabditis auriculariae]